MTLNPLLHLQAVKYRNLHRREAQLSRVVLTSVFFWALAWTPYAGESSLICHCAIFPVHNHEKYIQSSLYEYLNLHFLLKLQREVIGVCTSAVLLLSDLPSSDI